jgi:hypothetical protein
MSRGNPLPKEAARRKMAGLVRRNELMIKFRIVIVVFLGLAAIGPARAAVIFANLTDSSIGNRGLATTAQYQSFSNVTAGMFLTDIELLLSGNNTDAHTFSVDLYADSSTSPGTLLDHIASMSDSSLTASCACVYDFPTAAFALSANTRYWIGLSTSNGATVNWQIEGPFQGHPGDIGVTGEFTDDTGVVSSDNGEAFQMQVTVGAGGASVPEPATFLLGGAGLLGLAFLRRRQLH